MTWEPATLSTVPVPLSDYDRDAIAWMYRDGRPVREIEAAIGRSHGTVSTAIRALRVAGRVERRRVRRDA